MKVFAHRGDSSSAPENTMAAFERAIAAGADGVEFDVHLTRDGVPVVIHDESLGRTAGAPGAVADRTLAQLAGLDAGGWFAPEFAGQRIPLLCDVLELFRPTGLALNIELKTGLAPYPGLVAAVARLVEGLALGERVILSSFNHFSLLEAGSLAPGLETAALVYEHLLEPWAYAARHGFKALHPTFHAVTAELVERCHAQGLAVRCWTVDEQEPFERLMALGVDGIITNTPRAALQWRAQRMASGE